MSFSWEILCFRSYIGSVLRDCIEELLPIIARIVNLSLQSAVMPHDLKETVLKPKIKKHSLDSELLSNFRPISNIRFLAKAFEKAIAFKLDYHLINSNAHELYQAPLAHIIKHHNLC